MFAFVTRSIRIGSLTHLSANQLAENVVASLPKIVAKHVKGGWENVQSIDIKTGSSAALPVWNSKLDDRWIGMPEPTQSEDEEDDVAEENEQEKAEEKVEIQNDKEVVKSKKPKSNDGEKKLRSSISKETISPKVTKKSKKTA